MAEQYFTNFTPHDIVLYRKDGTTVTIPRSGKVASVAGISRLDFQEPVDGVPIFYERPIGKKGIEGVTFNELIAAKNVIVSTMTAQFLSTDMLEQAFFAVYAPSTCREDQVRDEKGAVIGTRALQRYC